MLWRVWLLRTAVCSFCVAFGVLGWLTYLHTNSEAIRLKVVEELQGNSSASMSKSAPPGCGRWAAFPSAICAWRRDDPTHPFLTVQAATVYHDKEQLAHGRLVIRKLELDQPALLIRRDVEGNWNLAGITKPGGGADDTSPTFVIRKGVVRYEDRTGGTARPILEVTDVNCWTLVDGPQSGTSFQGDGRSMLGPVKWHGAVRHDSTAPRAVVEFPGFDLTQPLLRDVAKHVPELADYVADLQAHGTAKLELRIQPGSRPVVHPDLRVSLHGGRFRHPRLPMPLNALELSLRYHDDQISVERCQAESGSTKVQLSFDATIPAAGARATTCSKCSVPSACRSRTCRYRPI